MGLLSYTPMTPQEGDSEMTLLGKILVTLQGGAGGGGGVGTSSTLTGYSAAVGTISASDTILTAFNKLGAVVNNGNVGIGDGTAAAPSLFFTSDSDGSGTGIYRSGTNQLSASTNGTERLRVTSLGATAIGLSLGATPGAADVLLGREAANILVLGNSASVQTFRVYETTDSITTPANYARLSFRTQAGNHLIRTEAAGTGTLRILQVGTGPSAGSNIAGIDAILHSGQPTGSGAPGAILFQQGLPVGGSGSSVTALATSGQFTTAGLFSTARSQKAHDATAIPAGGTAGAGFLFSSTANFGIFFGSGAPGLAAAKGSLYLRSDGSGTADRAYINTDGSTAWTAIATAG